MSLARVERLIDAALVDSGRGRRFVQDDWSRETSYWADRLSLVHASSLNEFRMGSMEQSSEREPVMTGEVVAWCGLWAVYNTYCAWRDAVSLGCCSDDERSD